MSAFSCLPLLSNGSLIKFCFRLFMTLLVRRRCCSHVMSLRTIREVLQSSPNFVKFSSNSSRQDMMALLFFTSVRSARNRTLVALVKRPLIMSLSFLVSENAMAVFKFEPILYFLCSRSHSFL